MQFYYSSLLLLALQPLSSFGSALLQDRQCASYCGSENQFCCGTGQACYTSVSNDQSIAYCSAPPTGTSTTYSPPIRPTSTPISSSTVTVTFLPPVTSTSTSSPTSTPSCGTVGEFDEQNPHKLFSTLHDPSSAPQSCVNDCTLNHVKSCISFAARNTFGGLECNFFDVLISEVLIPAAPDEPSSRLSTFFNFDCFSANQTTTSTFTPTTISTSTSTATPTPTEACGIQGEFDRQSSHIIFLTLQAPASPPSSCLNDCTKFHKTGCMSFATDLTLGGLQCTFFDVPISEIFVPLQPGENPSRASTLFDFSCFSGNSITTTTVATSTTSKAAPSSTSCGAVGYIKGFNTTTNGAPHLHGQQIDQNGGTAGCFSSCANPFTRCQAWAGRKLPEESVPPGEECFFFDAPVSDVLDTIGIIPGQGPIFEFWDKECAVPATASRGPGPAAKKTGTVTASGGANKTGRGNGTVAATGSPTPISFTGGAKSENVGMEKLGILGGILGLLMVF